MLPSQNGDPYYPRHNGHLTSIRSLRGSMCGSFSPNRSPDANFSITFAIWMHPQSDMKYEVGSSRTRENAHRGQGQGQETKGAAIWEQTDGSQPRSLLLRDSLIHNTHSIGGHHRWEDEAQENEPRHEHTFFLDSDFPTKLTGPNSGGENERSGGDF